MPEYLQYWPVFVFSAVLSGLAGLAALLRSGNKITALSAVSSLLNSSLMGLGISLIWYTRFRENLCFLIGICIICGLGGMTTIDFILKAFRNGGFSIKLNGESTSINGDKNDDNSTKQS